MLQTRQTVCRRLGSLTAVLAALQHPAVLVPLPAVTRTAWPVSRNAPTVTRRLAITSIRGITRPPGGAYT